MLNVTRKTHGKKRGIEENISVNVEFMKGIQSVGAVEEVRIKHGSRGE